MYSRINYIKYTYHQQNSYLLRLSVITGMYGRINYIKYTYYQDESVSFKKTAPCGIFTSPISLLS